MTWLRQTGKDVFSSQSLLVPVSGHRLQCEGWSSSHWARLPEGPNQQEAFPGSAPAALCLGLRTVGRLQGNSDLDGGNLCVGSSPGQQLSNLGQGLMQGCPSLPRSLVLGNGCHDSDRALQF